MYLKHYYPVVFWWAQLTNENLERKRQEYKIHAVHDGDINLLPHVNGGANYEIKKIGKERVLQEGLVSIKGIGTKTANELVKYGPYKDLNDFLQKVPRKVANIKTLDILHEHGALEFNQDKFMK